MSEEIFILFDRFLVKKTDIIYAVVKDNHSVELYIKKGDRTEQLTMQYDDTYDANRALKMLGIETDAITLNHHKTALVQQMGWLTNLVRDTANAIEITRKELNSLRMELRRNRLSIKKDK